MGFLRGFSIAMGASTILLVLSFLNNKLIYVYLDKSDNGVYFIFMRFSMFISLVFGEWFRLSNINIAGGDKSTIPALSANNLWYSASVGTILVIAALALSQLSGSTFGGISWKYIWVALLVGVTVILRESFQSLLMVSQKMLAYGITFVVWGSVVLVMNIIFLLVFNAELDFVVTAWFLGILAGALWAFFSIVSYNGFHWKPSWQVFSMSGNIGIRAWLAVVGMFLMLNFHAFILGPLSGNTGDGLVMVAVFSVCFRFFQLLQRVSNVSGTILFSHVVRKDKNTGFDMTRRVTRNIILFSVIFSLGGMIAGKGIIRLISNSTYLMAYYPMLLMLPGIIAMNAGSVINGMYWGHGYPYKVILAPFVITIAGSALDVALIPRIGVSGATLSFSIMSVGWFAYITLLFKTDSGYRMSEILIPHREDIVQVTSRIKNYMFLNNVAKLQ